VFRLAAACEGLDDDHAAAAAATRTRQHAGFVGGCGRGRLGLFRPGRHCKLLIPGEVARESGMMSPANPE
jgi:hypothetical protein